LQNLSVFIWISMKKAFYHDFWWFFPVTSKKTKCHFAWFPAESIWFVWISIKNIFSHDLWWFFPVHKKDKKVIFSRYPAELTWLYLNQHEKMLFSRFPIIFPSFKKKDKMAVFLNFQQNWTEFIWISIKTSFSRDSWSFFSRSLLHQKRQNFIFSWFPAESIWFCLNQHENIFSHDFWWFFSQFHKKGKKLFSPDIQQIWPDFIWISMKKWFSHDFWWFFPVS